MGGNHSIQKNPQRAPKPWKFLAAFLVVFFMISTFLYIIDFVPESPAVQSSPIKATQVATSGIVQNLSQVEQFPIEEPVHVKAPSVGIDISVSDPSSTEVSTLDSALLKGAVRYPNSALLGQNAAVYLFGHQSYLPIVHNQAFKAFNGLQKLKAGDEVIVSSQSADYHYRVTSVRLVEASEATIDLSSGARKLILTTCDSFGTKTQRYVVEADFISRNPVTQK